MAKAFQSDFIYQEVEQAVQKILLKPQIVDAVATPMINAFASTVPVARFIKHEAEKNSFE